MPEAAEVVTLECKLEELRCSRCTGYLSCAPIQVVPDGSSICSRCPADDEQTYRNLKLEAILAKALFPCRYMKNGCEERLLFGHTDEHQINCDHRSFACPLSSGGTCAWEGSSLQILDHFTEKHSEYVMEKAEFKVQVDQNTKGWLIFVVDNAPFLIKFCYNAGTSNLHHYVCHFTRNLQEVAYKIRLISGVDQDYCFILKGGNCLPYSANFHNVHESDVLILNNFLQNLNNPNCVKIAVDLALLKSNDKNAQEQLDLDYDLLQKLRCAECEGHLIPPLCDCKKGVICSKCQEKFRDAKRLYDDALKERVAEADFACRWRDCDFIGKLFDFQEHAMSCPFRIYECVDRINCNDTFKLDEAVMHLEGHGYEYFDDAIVYKLIFDKEHCAKTIFTLKNNGIITIDRRTYYNTEEKQYMHELILNVTGTDFTKFFFKMQFEHQHCKVKSRTYTLQLFLSKKWWFVMDHFPECFKNDEELTAVLEIENI